MSWLTDPAACMDWNGDGVIDSWDAGIELGVVMSIADDLAREERISKMVRAIEAAEQEEIDNESFEQLCLENGLRMRDFEQSDITEIQRRLNRY